MTATPSQEWTERDDRDVGLYAKLETVGSGKHRFVVDVAIAFAREILRQREKIRGLNRRCQSAESGLAAKPTSGPNMGRALANAAATMYRKQLDEAKDEVARLRAENAEIKKSYDSLAATYDREYEQHNAKCDEAESLRAENERLTTLNENQRHNVEFLMAENVALRAATREETPTDAEVRRDVIARFHAGPQLDKEAEANRARLASTTSRSRVSDNAPEI